MKRRKVLLTVTGMTSDFGETDEAMRLVTTGTLTGEKDKWKLRYEESQLDTKEKRRITMTMDSGVVTMAREGAWGTNMVFQRGRRFETSYNTPFGAFGMGIFPTQVNYKVDDSGEGEIALRYQLDIQGQFSSVNDLRISFSANKQA
ncbi:MAG: DUF1934 domain-containing protein [Clostridiales bacterium]|jgi:uncharacterized beta-barrel protein YwiB (DUF1934 family)|nr:DUF1934 domain-containing protein [Clostridiales bacterium]